MAMRPVTPRERTVAPTVVVNRWGPSRIVVDIEEGLSRAQPACTWIVRPTSSSMARAVSKSGWRSRTHALAM